MHGAAWLMLKTALLTAMDPARAAVLEFEATEYRAVPLPVPLEPEVTEIQLSLLAAFQGQSLAADTENEPAPPLPPELAEAGLSETEHDA